LNYDEGPEKGGNYSPFLQSERLEIYNKHADELVKNKKPIIVSVPRKD
jgi:glutamyl/glutaminyl-tRNA synthetase